MDFLANPPWWVLILAIAAGTAILLAVLKKRQS